MDTVRIYWGAYNGVLRMPESLKIFNVDTSVCVASPEDCGDFISRVQPLYSKQKKYYLLNRVSKFNENMVYDDENFFAASDIIGWTPQISRAFGSEGIIQNDDYTCYDYGLKPCHQMRGPYPSPDIQDSNETDLALYNLDVHDKVMLTMRLWTNANYDSNATITVLVDGDIVVYYRRSIKDCVVDGWLGYPVGGIQKQICFMDLKEIVNHTRDAINVKVGIYFDGEGSTNSFFGLSKSKIYILTVQKRQDIHFSPVSTRYLAFQLEKESTDMFPSFVVNHIVVKASASSDFRLISRQTAPKIFDSALKIGVSSVNSPDDEIYADMKSISNISKYSQLNGRYTFKSMANINIGRKQFHYFDTKPKT